MTSNKLQSHHELFHQIAEFGNEEAFHILFDAYKPKLFSYLYSITKSHEAAEELLQETFLKIWVSRGSLMHVENPERYIVTIARNKALDYLRDIAKNKRLIEQLWLNVTESRNSTTEENLFAAESDELIQKAIHKLSPQKQLIFTLSRHDGLTHEQIASKLNISKNTVKNHLVESLKTIKTYLGRHFEAFTWPLIFLQLFD